MKTRIVQKAIVVNPMGEMLMLRRSATDERRPLDWDLPGGLFEKGEELRQSIEREIDEETGLSVTDVLPIYSKTEIRNFKKAGREYTENVLFIFYSAKAQSTDVKLSFEHDKFQWKAITEAVKEFEYYLHKDTLNHIIKNELLTTS